MINANLLAYIPPLAALALGGLAMADDAADGQARSLGQETSRPLSTNTHPDAQWFPDAGLGLFIHWGINSVRASGDLSWNMLANKPWKDSTVTPNQYYATIKDWHADRMDYDALLGAAKAAGFTYAIMVTKHHDGFALWPSAHGELNSRTQFAGRDFVSEYVAACRKHGLKVGLYFSPPDWWFEREYKSFTMKGPALDMDHQPVATKKKPADFEPKRRAMIQGQVTELLTRYGRIDLIWFDGGGGEIPSSEVRRLQPGIVINRRNGGGGDYGDTEVTLPDKRFAGWFETCATCWPSRKWSYSEGHGFDTAAVTLTKLTLLRAWGGNLLANVGPKGNGEVPKQAIDCWSEMARWMAHSRESVIGAQGGHWPEQANVPMTTRPGVAYLHFLPKFPEIYPGSPVDNPRRTREVLCNPPPYTTTAVWKDAPRPARVTLLRTGQDLPYTYADRTLTVSLPPDCRSGLVDVVKVEK